MDAQVSGDDRLRHATGYTRLSLPDVVLTQYAAPAAVDAASLDGGDALDLISRRAVRTRTTLTAPDRS